MNRLPLLIFSFYLTAVLPLQAQDAATGETAKRPTTVTSETFRLDMTQKRGLFSGNVKVDGSDFSMNSRELEVYFDNNNKVEKLIAIGDVKIVQPNRETTANNAEYNVKTNKITLTGSPQINDNGKIISATEIVIDRKTDSLETKGGGQTKMIIPGNL